jgi:hypothetical protein
MAGASHGKPGHDGGESPCPSKGEGLKHDSGRDETNETIGEMMLKSGLGTL